MRLIIAVAISLLPFNCLRITAYRLLLGYDIDYKSRVAAFSVIDAENVRMRSASIGRLNLLRLKTLEIESGGWIGKMNFISRARRVWVGPGASILSRNFIGGTYGTAVCTDREDLLLGERSQISIGCFFDLSDTVMMGNNVVIGGAGTQFWTHAFDHLRNRSIGPIRIGDDVFVGSASTIVHGVEISSQVVIGAGAIVHRSITEPGLYVSAQLRKVR